MDQQREPYTHITESLDFICDPMADYRWTAEEKGKQPQPISLMQLIGDSARRLATVFR